MAELERQRVASAQAVIRFFDGAVELWDGAGGKRIRQLPAAPMFYLHGNGEWGGIDLSADGKRLALLHREADGAVGGRIVEVATGKDVATLVPEPMPPTSGNTCFSPDGRRVARVAYGVVRMWNAETGADACPLPGHRGAVVSMADADNGKLVVTTGEDLTVRGWDPSTSAERWHTVLPAATSVKFVTADSAIVSEDQRWDSNELAVRIDLATGKRRPLPGKLGAVKSPVPLALAPGGKRVVTLDRDPKKPALDVWSWPAGEPLLHVPLQPPGKLVVSRCSAASFTPDGKELVAVMRYDDPAAPFAMRQAPTQPFLERWDLTTGRLLERSTQTSAHPPRLLRHRNGVLLWTAGPELRDAVSGQVVVTLQLPDAAGIALPDSHAAIAPDGKQFAIAESSGADAGSRVLVFDVGTGTLARTLTVPSANRSRLHGLQFLPDGRLVTFGDTAIVWPVAAARP